MAWIKKGCIYKPAGEISWVKSHAQIPTALVLEDRIRVYIGVRPEQQKSLTVFLDLDIKDPSRILYIHQEPILECGGPGEFDQFGVMPSHAMHVGDEVWLYYGGWNRGYQIPNYVAIGLAVSCDGGKSFTKRFKGPLLSANRHHPHAIMSPHIRREGDIWHLWYGATTAWKEIDGRFEQTYNIFYGRSNNGIDWHLSDEPCVPGRDANECTIRPAVLVENGLYHMWFSHRQNQDYYGGDGSYRMGYATSKDGIFWQRNDSAAGIDLSASGWDSKMMSYPSIVDTPYGRYMFYNGNDFGIEGFGYAVWQV
ncbi:MAG: hypothetical protein SFT92_06865 [Rickettsiales bacterium]|nr:hypothetical protein [Rickettsiales bacterium]